jgi:hypothetical protein
MPTQNILLLTATITPKTGVPNLKRTDPALRLEDYKIALEFYLNQLKHNAFDGIVFAENSNSDVSSLKALVDIFELGDRVEFVVFDGLDYPPHYDRGYGEFKLIDYAMEHSTLIQGQTERAIVWKITGRYVVRNIVRLIQRQPAEFDIYCNFRNYPKCWVDTYLLAWTPAAYEACLKGVYSRLKTNVPEVPTGTAAEELLRQWLNQQKSLKFVRRFRVTPDIDGIRGADNQGYSKENLWKIQMRQLFNILFPWVWV